MRAYIVVDLGFGDSGKGLLTDFLVRHSHAGLVVRYNGGAQAGHNVVAPDGRHHTFSQFGSGTLVPGVKTFLSRHVVLHPGALLVEGQVLQGIGLDDAFDRLRISAQALVVTPFHQAANRIRELARGSDRHGSCGVGIGEAVEDDLASAADSVRAGDLGDPAVLRRKLRIIRERKRVHLDPLRKPAAGSAALAGEWEILERADVIDQWIATVSRIAALGLVASDDVLQRWVNETEAVVFEGAQGVLLDAERGFHPYTTWSRCTTGNADELIAEVAPDARVLTIGVLRSYAVRHGAGPLPTETDALAPIVFDHNRHNEWQGAVRYGWFDAVLARYALSVTGGVDALAITHLDILSRLYEWKYCAAYATRGAAYPTRSAADRTRHPSDSVFGDPGPDGVLTDLRSPHSNSLAQRTQFTEALTAVEPVLETCEPEEAQVIRKIETLLGQPIALISRGPRAADVHLSPKFPLW